MNSIKKIIAAAPDASGVYIMKDSSGKILYIGKAKSLKKRLTSYLSRELADRTQALMANVTDIELRLTPTEALALVLEAALVHQHQPKYNVMLRDDKSFPFVKITNEEFPAICVVRKKESDGAAYFGPYTSAKLLREALIVIRRHFPYRSCKTLPKKACIYYRIGLSPAPCIGKISKREYVRTLENISLILEGRTDSLIRKLGLAMKQKAKEHKFEEAAAIRDQIAALSEIGPMQAGPYATKELEDLKNLIGLKRLPERIEAFDISNVSGKEACGSMVSFYKGSPDKNNYRRFKIKTVEGIDDYRMLAEVVRRRYARLIEEKLIFPDLILIDGGKGHLLTAEQEVRKLGLPIPLISIAKQEENIYTTNKPSVISFSSDTPALNLIRRIRDEAHRFAVAYHHVLRRKKIIGK